MPIQNCSALVPKWQNDIKKNKTGCYWSENLFCSFYLMEGTPFLPYKGRLLGTPALRGYLLGVSFFFSTMVRVRGSPFGNW